MIEEIKDLSILENILKTFSGLVVIDFYAQWCGPCKQMIPFLQELATGFNEVKIVKIDVEAVPEAMEEFEVSAMPTFIFIKEKEIKTTIVGADLAGVYEAMQKYR